MVVKWENMLEENHVNAHLVLGLWESHQELVNLLY
jgi:hypothetical protein